MRRLPVLPMRFGRIEWCYSWVIEFFRVSGCGIVPLCAACFRSHGDAAVHPILRDSQPPFTCDRKVFLFCSQNAVRAGMWSDPMDALKGRIRLFRTCDPRSFLGLQRSRAAPQARPDASFADGRPSSGHLNRTSEAKIGGSLRSGVAQKMRSLWIVFSEPAGAFSSAECKCWRWISDYGMKRACAFVAFMRRGRRAWKRTTTRKTRTH